MRALLALALAFALPTSLPAAGDLEPYDLRCEFLTNPVGVDEKKPRFSWKLQSKTRGIKESAYHILVASSAELLARNEGDLWDSLKTNVEPLLYHKYGGDSTLIATEMKGRKPAKPLQSGQEVFWKVKSWGRVRTKGAGPADELRWNEGPEVEGDWSEPARFTMGLMVSSDWKAEWISCKDPRPLPRNQFATHLPPPRYYRKPFEIKKNVKRALAFATSLGIHDLHLNGKKVGDAYFAPGWTDYHTRVYYHTHDITSLVKQGPNCIGAIVADGWYAGYVGFGKRMGYGPNKSGRNIYGRTPTLLVQVQIEYEDGSSEMVPSDPSWQVGTGPESAADLLMGESYDASKEIAGWCTAGFEAGGWKNAIPAADLPKSSPPFLDAQGRRRGFQLSFKAPGLIEAYPCQPVRVTQELGAKMVSEPRPGTWIFDFGQNFTGNVRLKVKGEKGQKLVLRYGERLQNDGQLLTSNLGEARATDTYLCKGDPDGESWTPRFTFHGFRYAEIRGLREKPPLDTLTGLVIHNDLALTSGFECSDPVVNRVFQNCVWTHRGSFLDIPTSCPQGDERLGWAADAQLSMRAGCYHADARAFYGKWMRELQESRTEEGYYPSYAPYPFGHGSARHASAWSDAGVICPFDLWWMYGERDVIKSRFFAIEKYMNARRKADPKLEGTKFGAPWGDAHHLDDETPIQFIDLCYLALDCRLMMEIAKITRGPATFLKYRDWFTNLLESFKSQYVNPDGSLKVKTQTAHALALRFGLVPAEHRDKVVEDLLGLIGAKQGPEHSGMTTGILGTKALMTVLTWSGNHDEALRLVQSRQFPSWGYQAEKGATTIWERWDADQEKPLEARGGNPLKAPGRFSNHAFGTVSEWMMSKLAGIDTLEPGFRNIRLEPWIPADPPAPQEGVSSTGRAPAPIKWVRAHYDSAQGRIAVHWERRADGSLLYEATIPPNTRARLKLPARPGAVITENGRDPAEAEGVHVIPDPNIGDNRAYFALVSGSYRFEVKSGG